MPNSLLISTKKIAIILIILPLFTIIITPQQPAVASPYSAGYDHGCSDAQAGGHPYLNSPGKGPPFHTADFMNGYNDGYKACSASSNDVGSNVAPTINENPQGTSTSSVQPIITKTYNLVAGSTTFPIRYAITGDGNVVSTISWEQSVNTLSISISSQSNGKLIIELPRMLIDSPRVLVDGATVPAQQTTVNSEVRTLVIDFQKSSNIISIYSAPAEVAAPSPSPSPQPSTAPSPENPSSMGGTDYSSICAELQPVLIPSCGTLVNSDGSLTFEGTHAMHCIRNGIILGGGAALYGLPLSLVLKGLSMLAAPTGCDGIVNMQAFDQLGNIGSLSSLKNLLP